MQTNSIKEISKNNINSIFGGSKFTNKSEEIIYNIGVSIGIATHVILIPIAAHALVKGIQYGIQYILPLFSENKELQTQLAQQQELLENSKKNHATEYKL